MLSLPKRRLPVACLTLAAAHGSLPAQPGPTAEDDQRLLAQAVRVFRGDGTWTRSIAVSPDGKYVAAGYVLKTYLWDIKSGKERFVISNPAWVRTVSFAPDGEFLAGAASCATNGERAIMLWDTATGKELRRLGPPSGLDQLIAFNPDGRHLHLAGLNYMETWDALKGKKVSRVELARGFLGIAFAPDCKTVALYGDTSRLPGYIADTLALHDVTSGQELWRAGPEEGRTTRYASPAFAADGKSVAVFLGDGVAHLYDVASGKKLRTFGDGQDLVPPNMRNAGYPFLAFSRDGKYLAGGDVRTPHGAAYVWEVATGKEVRRFRFSHSAFQAAAFTPDSKTVALATLGGVFLFPVEMGKMRKAAPGL